MHVQAPQDDPQEESPATPDGPAMPVPLAHEASYEDVLNAPQDKVAQVIDGEFYLLPRPAIPHAKSTSSLARRLGGFEDDEDGGGPGGWHILFEPELHFLTGRTLKNGNPAKNILVPDLAGWRRERLPALPNVAFMELAPDWVCEVLSPSTARIDRIKKLRIYHQQKVGHLWFIDPIAQILEVMSYSEPGYVLLNTHAGDEVVRAAPFDAIELKLKYLWT